MTAERDLLAIAKFLVCYYCYTSGEGGSRSVAIKKKTRPPQAGESAAQLPVSRSRRPGTGQAASAQTLPC